MTTEEHQPESEQHGAANDSQIHSSCERETEPWIRKFDSFDDGAAYIKRFIADGSPPTPVIVDDDLMYASGSADTGWVAENDFVVVGVVNGVTFAGELAE